MARKLDAEVRRTLKDSAMIVKCFYTIFVTEMACKSDSELFSEPPALMGQIP